MRQEEVACIFCGRSKPRRALDLDKFAEWSIEWSVLQVREILPGPGRGKRIKGRRFGFPAVEEEGKSVLEMVDDEEYQEIVDAIKGRLIMIVNAYIKAGIIGRDEIVG